MVKRKPQISTWQTLLTAGMWLWLSLSVPLAIGTQLNESTPTCGLETLPEEVRKIISAQFPGYRPTSVFDLDDVERQLWTKSRPGACPGIALGRFRSSKEAAYAAVLRRNENNIVDQVLVVFAKGSKEAYRHWVLDRFKGDRPLVVYPLQPGRFNSADGTLRITTKNEVLAFEALEAGVTIFYWSKGQFRSLTTSE